MRSVQRVVAERPKPVRADDLAMWVVPPSTGFGMVLMQEANKVMRHCAIGRVWRKSALDGESEQWQSAFQR